MIVTTDLTNILILIFLLQIKHFICDGPLQTLAMVNGKGVYCKPIGLSHGLIHGVGTGLMLAIMGFPLILVLKLALLEGVLHYHIDFLKERLVRINGWGYSDSSYWWALTGDQTLHHMTYLLVAWLTFTL